MVIGLIPLLWGATLLCALVACVFRLNHPGIQAANYLMYPLQLVLLLPFYRLGEAVFPGGTVHGVSSLANWATAAMGLDAVSVILATLKAVAAWLLVAPLAAFILYLLMLPLITRMLPLAFPADSTDADIPSRG
jgi:hypothetical protein